MLKSLKKMIDSHVGGGTLVPADHKKYVLSYFLNISKIRELSEGLTGLAVYKHISGGESILEAGHRTDHM